MQKYFNIESNIFSSINLMKDEGLFDDAFFSRSVNTISDQLWVVWLETPGVDFLKFSGRGSRSDGNGMHWECHRLATTTMLI